MAKKATVEHRVKVVRIRLLLPMFPAPPGFSHVPGDGV